MAIRVFVTLVTMMGIATPAALAQDLRVYKVAGGGREFDARDGMRATGVYLSPGPVTVRADGSFLVSGSSSGFVWRVDNRGQLRRVIGVRRLVPADGDGGPARSASTSGVSSLATQPDGGTLIAEANGCGVRRIAPDGIVTRVAGVRPVDTLRPCWTYPSPAGELGEGGPATEAHLPAPIGVAATADGGFLIADQALQRILKVDGDGTITTVAGGGSAQPPPSRTPYTGSATDAALQSPSDVAALPSGGFRFVDSSGLHEVGPDGTIQTLLPNPPYGTSGFAVRGLSETGMAFGSTMKGSSPQRRFRVFSPGGGEVAFGVDPGFFAGDGEPLARANMPDLAGVEQLPGGGLLLSSSDAVRAALPTGTQRLAVAIARESIRSLTHRRLALRLTVPAALSIEIYSGRELVRRLTAQRRPGLVFVRVPRGVRTDLYNFRVIADARGGATTSSRLRLIVGPGVPIKAAELEATNIYWTRYARAADQYPYSVVRRCHRFARTRVDCIVGEEDSDPDLYCIYMAAVFRRADGALYTRPYDCPGRRAKFFRRAPRWTGKLEVGAPL